MRARSAEGRASLKVSFTPSYPTSEGGKRTRTLLCKGEEKKHLGVGKGILPSSLRVETLFWWETERCGLRKGEKKGRLPCEGKGRILRGLAFHFLKHARGHSGRKGKKVSAPSSVLKRSGWAAAKNEGGLRAQREGGRPVLFAAGGKNSSP